MNDLREWLKNATLTEIEAELQKQYQKMRVLEMNLVASNKAMTNRSAELNTANQLLEQTIEVLEGLATAIDFYFVHEDGEGERRSKELYESRQAAHALLDKLQALKKEPDAHQQAVKEMLAPKPIDHVDGGFKP